MTSCFHIMSQIGQNQRQDDAYRYVSSSWPGGGTGDEVCCLLLHLVYLGESMQHEGGTFLTPIQSCFKHVLCDHSRIHGIQVSDCLVYLFNS